MFRFVVAFASIWLLSSVYLHIAVTAPRKDDVQKSDSTLIDGAFNKKKEVEILESKASGSPDADSRRRGAIVSNSVSPYPLQSNMTIPSETRSAVYDDPIVRKVHFLFDLPLPNRTGAQARRSKREKLLRLEQKHQSGSAVESEEDDDVPSEAVAKSSCAGFGDQKQVQSVNIRSDREKNHSGTNRIAFLFLVRGPIATEPIWRAFFGVPKGQPHGCPAPKIRDPRVSVHVHSSPFFEPPESSIFARHTLTNRTFVSWGSFAVVDAMVLLLRAALRDSQNKHFAFFSEKCVPLHSLPCTHAFFASAERSFVAAWKTGERRHMYNFTVDRNRIAGYHASDKKRGGDVGGRKARRTAWPPSTVDYGSHWRKGHMWVVLHRRDAVLVAHPLVVGEWVAAHVHGHGTVADKFDARAVQRFGGRKFYNSFDTSVYRDGLGNINTNADLQGESGERFADSQIARMDHWHHRPIADEHYIHTCVEERDDDNSIPTITHGREWDTIQDDKDYWLGVSGGDDSVNTKRNMNRKSLLGAASYSLHYIQMKGWHASELHGKQMASDKGSMFFRSLRGFCAVSESGKRKKLFELGPPYPDDKGALKFENKTVIVNNKNISEVDKNYVEEAKKEIVRNVTTIGDEEKQYKRTLENENETHISGSQRMILTTSSKKKKHTKEKSKKEELSFTSPDRGWEAHKGEYGGGDSCNVTLHPLQQQQEKGQHNASRRIEADHLCYFFLRKVAIDGVSEYLHQSPHFREHLRIK